MTADWEQLGADALTPWQEAIVELHKRLSRLEGSGNAKQENAKINVPAPLLKKEVARLVPRLQSVVSYFCSRLDMGKCQGFDRVMRRNSSMASDCALAIALLEALGDHVVS